MIGIKPKANVFEKKELFAKSKFLAPLAKVALS
jgi:hypothetical protein